VCEKSTAGNRQQQSNKLGKPARAICVKLFPEHGTIAESRPNSEPPSTAQRRSGSGITIWQNVRLTGRGVLPSTQARANEFVECPDASPCILATKNGTQLPGREKCQDQAKRCL